MVQLIAICVATYVRPAAFRRLVESLGRIQLPPDTEVELRIVDNDSAGSAKATLLECDLPAGMHGCISYEIEPQQGIASARNRALDMGPADAFIFVDDDEYVSENWLKALVSTWRSTGADVVLGPVTGMPPEGSPAWFERGGFFHKEVGPDGKELDWRSGRTSNTLVSGHWFTERGKRFDAAFGRSGGSDSHLFFRIAAEGARLVACDSARVHEDVEPERMSVTWLWKRTYRNGMVFQRITNESRVPLRTAWRVAKAGGQFLRGLPALLVGRPERAVRALLLVALAAGGWKAWRRPDEAAGWVEYGKRTDDGDASASAGSTDPSTDLEDIPAALPKTHDVASSGSPTPPTES